MSAPGPSLSEFLVGRINLGILVVDRQYRIVLWNRFMETHTGRTAAEVSGRTLFECFPELPRTWLQKKLESVFILKSYAFTSWEQRPYLFRMAHNRPITGGVDCMRQNCTFLPVRGATGEVDFVCVTVEDRTESAISEARLNEAMKEIEFLSVHDSLTGLLNRRALEEVLEKELYRARRHLTAFSVVLFDIDRFKGINDAHGHLCGDEVLRHVARSVESTIRRSDFAGRFGGDEFILVLPSTGSEGACLLAERFREKVGSEPVLFEGVKIPIAISAGVTTLRTFSQTYLGLVEEADQALYASKLAGRNRVILFSDAQETPLPLPVDPGEDTGVA